MKTAFFTIGQSVVCIKGGPWIADHPSKPTTAIKGEIYTVSGMEYWPQWDDWYLQLVECPPDAAYLQEHFAPVLPDKELAALLTESLELAPA